MLPHWNKHNTNIVSAFVKINDKIISLLIFDKDVSDTIPVYMFSFSEAGRSSIMKLLNNDISNTVETAGLSQADYLAWLETGVMPM